MNAEVTNRVQNDFHRFLFVSTVLVHSLLWALLHKYKTQLMVFHVGTSNFVFDYGQLQGMLKTLTSNVTVVGHKLKNKTPSSELQQNFPSTNWKRKCLQYHVEEGAGIFLENVGFTSEFLTNCNGALEVTNILLPSSKLKFAEECLCSLYLNLRQNPILKSKLN